MNILVFDKPTFKYWYVHAGKLIYQCLVVSYNSSVALSAFYVSRVKNINIYLISIAQQQNDTNDNIFN